MSLGFFSFVCCTREWDCLPCFALKMISLRNFDSVSAFRWGENRCEIIFSISFQSFVVHSVNPLMPDIWFDFCFVWCFFAGEILDASRRWAAARCETEENQLSSHANRVRADAVRDFNGRHQIKVSWRIMQQTTLHAIDSNRGALCLDSFF